MDLQRPDKHTYRKYCNAVPNSHCWCTGQMLFCPWNAQGREPDGVRTLRHSGRVPIHINVAGFRHSNEFCGAHRNDIQTPSHLHAHSGVSLSSNGVRAQKAGSRNVLPLRSRLGKVTCPRGPGRSVRHRWARVSTGGGNPETATHRPETVRRAPGHLSNPPEGFAPLFSPTSGPSGWH